MCVQTIKWSEEYKKLKALKDTEHFKMRKMIEFFKNK